MNSVGHDGETAGKFPLGRGHFSCIWKEVKEFSKEEISGILGRGNRGASQRNTESKGTDGRVSGWSLES